MTARALLERWRFPLLLAVLLAVLLASFRPFMGGDVVEYALDTVALASHGTPDIRLADIERARSMSPALAEPYTQLEQGMRANAPQLYAAFARGREGKVYSIHFFGYSALAALPFKAFDRLHVDPFKAFQVVNLAAVFALGLALRRFFRSELKAFAGLLLFMLAGGALYWTWTSPECVSAAGLLAGLLLFAADAPVAGALLAGLAGQQNPTIVMFFGFAPLLKLCLDYRPALGLVANLRAVLHRRALAGLAAGLAVFALPPLFNLYQFGTPNLIAKLYSDPQLIGLVRLESFFFDLNQGMIVGVPAVLAALAAWGWNGARRQALLLAGCAAFTLALALPALAVLNWNSGAAGVMRYAFWAAMPFVFALLLRLRARARWPAPLLLGLGLAQAACMVNAHRYDYVEFSPAARFMLAHAPGLYHPEPEIFAERAGHNDDYIEPGKVYAYTAGGQRIKTLVHRSNPHADQLVCGSGAVLAADNHYVNSSRGWQYIDGAPHCQAGAMVQQGFQFEQFRSQEGIRLANGWSQPEANGGAWNGVWSVGARSRLLVTPQPGLHAAALSLAGMYLGERGRTRVSVNGTDLGWHRLDLEGALALPAAAGAAAQLDIELEHEAPRSPGPDDARLLAFFLREVIVRAGAR
jgi:hypothetical protein